MGKWKCPSEVKVWLFLGLMCILSSFTKSASFRKFIYKPLWMHSCISSMYFIKMSPLKIRHFSSYSVEIIDVEAVNFENCVALEGNYENVSKLFDSINKVE